MTNGASSTIGPELTREVGSGGRFVRQANRFTTPFGNEPGDLPVEPGRYRLLWAPICPWASWSYLKVRAFHASATRRSASSRSRRSGVRSGSKTASSAPPLSESNCLKRASPARAERHKVWIADRLSIAQIALVEGFVARIPLTSTARLH